MADYVSPEARRRIATGLMAAQYAENPPTAPMGYDWNAAPLSPGLMNFAAQRGQPGVIQKTLGLIPGFDQDGKRGAQSWGNALMSTAQFPIDAVAGIGQAITAPARAYRGEFDPVSEEGVGEALNVAGNAMMGGLAAPKPRNVVGSAGGELRGAALGAIPEHPLLRQLADEGYDTSRMLHRGTRREEDGFRMDRTGTNEVAGIYTAPRERIAQDYGDFIHRGFLKNGRTLEMNARKWEPTDNAAAQELAKAGIDTSRLHDREMVQKLRDLGYTAVDQTGKKGNTWATVALNESDIRPITAAQAEEIRAVRPDLFANGGRPGAAAGAALGAPQSLNDPALAEILRKYGLDVPSRPASPQYRPGDA